ncbi:MAG: DNA polymerase III subunit gamma/tau [Clostridiales bacterium]|nr:DNA polymerase III subunit gamma/tau [Clostridiales bacterium]
MHQALYRKWRPKTFDEVCGQEQITSVLKYELENNKTSHAYLFCGSRGTGKTTCAKIFAKAINCTDLHNGSPCGICESCVAIEGGYATDIYEMDAASNNGVDDVRAIRDEVVYAPTTLKSRVYIIDEVHMLSDSAFNALLKTLEEPPSQVVFILATTEPKKVLPTVLSRCQRFDFRRIDSKVIADRLMFIAKEEEIEIEPAAAMYIARLSQGGMRDAISLLELCAGDTKPIDVETVESVSGAISRGLLSDAVRAVISNNAAAIFEIIADIYGTSKDIAVFWQELIAYYRDLMVVKSVKNPESYLDITRDDLEELKRISADITMPQLVAHNRQLDEAYSNMQGGRSAESKRVTAEMTLIRMGDNKLSSSPENLLSRIASLENRLAVIELNPSAISDISENSMSGAADKKTDESPKKSKDIESSVGFEPDKAMNMSAQVKKLISLRNWSDVIEKFSLSDKMTSSFLSGSKAYREEGSNKVHIALQNSFSAGMLDKPDVKRTIASLIASDGGFRPAQDDILFISSQDNSGTAGLELIDELIDQDN